MCILVQIHMAICFSGVRHKAHNCKTFPTPPTEPAVTAAERQMPVAINAWLAIFQVTVYPGKRFPCCLQCCWLPKARVPLRWELYLENLRCKCALHLCRGDRGPICLLSPSHFPISTSLHLCLPGTWVPRECGKVASFVCFWKTSHFLISMAFEGLLQAHCVKNVFTEGTKTHCKETKQ